MDNETIIIAVLVIGAIIVACIGLCIVYAALLVVVKGIGAAWRGE